MKPPSPRRPNGSSPATRPATPRSGVQRSGAPGGSAPHTSPRQPSATRREQPSPAEDPQRHEHASARQVPAPQVKKTRAAAPSPLARPIGQSDAAAVLGAGGAQGATDFEKRRQERARAKRSYVLHTFMIVVAGVVVVATLGWVLLFSPLFALNADHITAQGHQSGILEPAVLIDVARPYEATPLPRIPTGAIEAQIRDIPAVASAQVHRRWPTGLHIAVTLREGAMVENVDGEYRLVDAKGVAFATVTELPAGLPQVSLAQEGREDAAADVIAVWTACSDTLKSRITTVSADGKTVSFTVDTGARVLWGTAQDSPLKAQVLEVLLNQRDAQLYDVSAPAHPVTS